MVHVYRAAIQPATRYRVEFAQNKRWGFFVVKHPNRRLLYASCCCKRRIARNLRVQSYYDMDIFTCRPGTGCKKGR